MRQVIADLFDSNNSRIEVHDVLSALFLLVKADNGGGDLGPLRRFGPFGLGYWWADHYKPEWHAQLGEPFLGGSWFGFWAAVSWAASSVFS